MIKTKLGRKRYKGPCLRCQRYLSSDRNPRFGKYCKKCFRIIQNRKQRDKYKKDLIYRRKRIDNNSPENRKKRKKPTRKSLTPQQKEAARERMLHKKYGMTSQEFLDRVSAQQNKCKLCNRIFGEVKGRLDTAQVDHDHATGKVRGIICGVCNTAMGKLGDTVEKIERIVKYMKFENID